MVRTVSRKNIIALLITAVLLLSCFVSTGFAHRTGKRHTHSKKKGALIGGVAGAVGGALIGGKKGAVIGAGAGAGVRSAARRPSSSRSLHHCSSCSCSDCPRVSSRPPRQRRTAARPRPSPTSSTACRRPGARRPRRSGTRGRRRRSRSRPPCRSRCSGPACPRAPKRGCGPHRTATSGPSGSNSSRWTTSRKAPTRAPQSGWPPARNGGR